MKNRVVSVTEFKAKCLTMLNDVDQGETTITLTKRGRPIATIQKPKHRKRYKSPEGMLAHLFTEADIEAFEAINVGDMIRKEIEGEADLYE